MDKYRKFYGILTAPITVTQLPLLIRMKDCEKKSKRLYFWLNLALGNSNFWYLLLIDLTHILKVMKNQSGTLGKSQIFYQVFHTIPHILFRFVGVNTTQLFQRVKIRLKSNTPLIRFFNNQKNKISKIQMSQIISNFFFTQSLTQPAPAKLWCDGVQKYLPIHYEIMDYGVRYLCAILGPLG